MFGSSRGAFWMQPLSIYLTHGAKNAAVSGACLKSACGVPHLGGRHGQSRICQLSARLLSSRGARLPLTPAHGPVYTPSLTPGGKYTGRTKKPVVVRASAQRQTVIPEKRLEVMAPQVVLCVDNQICFCDKEASDFLRNQPRGAYTVGRTYNRDSIFEFEFHVSRLANSIRLMMESDADKMGMSPAAIESCYPDLLDEAKLRSLLISNLLVAGAEFSRQFPHLSGELKVTVLITWAEPGQNDAQSGATCSLTPKRREHHISVHLSPLPPRPKPPVRIKLFGAPRQNAAAKDSEWIRLRSSLEAEKGPEFNEVCMVGDDGSVLEGLSSNFYAIQDGQVITAGEGILLGSVRDLILEVCDKAGIPVRLEAPKVADVARWQGAFISSTSRLVLPVGEIHHRVGAVPGDVAPSAGANEGDVQVHRYEDSLVYTIERLVLEQMAAHSTKIW
eukprot:jgi/Mesvir1/882/Mv17448-RA.1